VQDRSFTFIARLAPVPFAQLRPSVEAALKAEGFGVLTEIDVQATIKAKLDVDRPPFLILGACNPSLSHRMLEVEPAIGALLPCNVVLREDGDAVVVEMMDPRMMVGMIDNAVVREIAEDTRGRLRKAMAAIEREFAPAAPAGQDTVVSTARR
jgi:uncharacterized protein (DUF302 family)